jgi:hypothetical protein
VETREEEEERERKNLSQSKKKKKNGSKVPLLLFRVSCEVLHPRVKLCHPPFPGSNTTTPT